MPQVVKCHSCDEVLYDGEDLKSPEEVHQLQDGKCPKCGRKLSLMPHDVEVKPVSTR